MAKTEAVWGIDIGNCSLKAIRCIPGDEPDQIVASAFDYIEYPKILTQPGADQTELISEALTQFLSRNSLRGDKVAISVSGQNGLARFIKLPPVEVKKIPDVVSYEVKQQIPFDLNDVIWDYQRMGGAVEEDGFALEAEVGLFAMKKDQVFQTLEPFDAAAIEVDCIQLAPLVLFNLMVYDQLTDRPAPDDYDPEDPPPSVVVLSIGTDSSDLIITDGFRTWQRSLLVGGNHFTKALTKELKLTFAKAEHLKRNAQQAEDPKAVFQAMRPVFQNLVDEIHRSLSYFNGLNRTAKIDRILLTGNTSKLPGLQRFLSQNLGMEVERLETFKRLFGPEVTDAPVFRDNLSCFSIAYGLAIQGLGESQIRTNFIPKQIIQDRLIRSKKPWAVAAASVLMLGCAISLAGWKISLNQVADSKFGPSLQEASAAVSKVDGYKSKASTIETEMKDAEAVGSNLVKNIEGRTAWMELMYSLTQALPSDQIPVDNMALRNELHIASIGSQIFTSTDDVTSWLETNSKWLHKLETTQKTDATATAKSGTTKTSDSADTGSSSDSDSSDSDSESSTEEEAPPAPAGTPYLITIKGFHYHNPIRMPKELSGAEYLRRVFLDKLLSGSVQLPTGDPNTPYEEVAYKDVQIVYPALIDPRMPQDREILNPKIQAAIDKRQAELSRQGMGMGGMGMGGGMSGGMSGMGGMGMGGGMSGGMSGMGGGMDGMGMGGGMSGMGMGMGGGMSGMGGMGMGGGMSGGRGGTGATMSRGDSLRRILVDENNALPEGVTDDDFSEDNLMVIVSQFDFEVQFLWIPTSHNERLRIKAAEAEEAGTADETDGTAAEDETVDDDTTVDGSSADNTTVDDTSVDAGTDVTADATTGTTDTSVNASNMEGTDSSANGATDETTISNTDGTTDETTGT